MNTPDVQAEVPSLTEIADEIAYLTQIHALIDILEELSDGMFDDQIQYGPLDDEIDATQWFADAVNARKDEGHKTWVVYSEKPDPTWHSDPNTCRAYAIVGNGPSSERRAMFYTFCHNAMPVLIALFRELIEAATPDEMAAPSPSLAPMQDIDDPADRL